MPRIDVDQLGLDNGSGLATLLRRSYVGLLEQAFDDVSESLSLELAFDVENEDVQRVLAELALLVRNVAETTKEQIRDLVSQQASEGWSIPELADRIEQLGEIESARRGRVIARTETASAYTKGSLLAYQESGVVAEIEWLLSPESCPICVAIQAATPKVPLGELFSGGTMVPAHPNCTCSIAPIVGSS